MINTVILNAGWDGVSLYYDYKEPFNSLSDMNESIVVGCWLNEPPSGN